jgi:hypothetical protein
MNRLTVSIVAPRASGRNLRFCAAAVALTTNRLDRTSQPDMLGVRNEERLSTSYSVP